MDAGARAAGRAHFRPQGRCGQSRGGRPGDDDDLADDDRAARSDLFRLRGVRGRLPALFPARGDRRAGFVARRADPGADQPGGRNRLAASRRHELRRQPAERPVRHDPRPGDVRQQGHVPGARHVRPGAAVRRRYRRAADPGPGDQFRPGRQGRHDGRAGQQGRAEAGGAGADRRRAARDHQRADARPTRW